MSANFFCLCSFFSPFFNCLQPAAFASHSRNFTSVEVLFSCLYVLVPTGFAIKLLAVCVPLRADGSLDSAYT